MTQNNLGNVLLALGERLERIARHSQNGPGSAARSTGP
jgi:hypothetical protein